jgi:hypothetical protein
VPCPQVSAKTYEAKQIKAVASGAYSVLGNTFSTEFVLIFGKSNTSSIASKILCGIGDKSSPTTTNVEKSIKYMVRSKYESLIDHVLIGRFEVQLAADNSKLVVLELFQTLLDVGI